MLKNIYSNKELQEIQVVLGDEIITNFNFKFKQNTYYVSVSGEHNHYFFIHKQEILNLFLNFLTQQITSKQQKARGNENRSRN